MLSYLAVTGIICFQEPGAAAALGDTQTNQRKHKAAAHLSECTCLRAKSAWRKPVACIKHADAQNNTFIKTRDLTAGKKEMKTFSLG